MPDQAARSQPRRVSRAPVLILIVGLGLAGALVMLGASLAARPAPPPSSIQPGTSGSPRVINVILRDYVFNPDPLYLTPAETVTFNIVNGGLVEHELVLGDATVQQAWAAANAAATPPGPFASAPVASVPAGTGGLRVLLRSGESTTATYRVPDAQQLELMCHIPGHLEQGMRGQVVLSSR